MEEQELRSRFRAGDEGAVSDLLTRYGPLLRYIIWGILSDPGEREECFGQVSLLIWEKRVSYDPAKGPLKPWLATLARNAALNRARCTGMVHQELTDTIPDLTPGPEERVLAKERAARIQGAVDKLPRLDRNLFYRKYCYFQSADQMAAELGMTCRAVESRLYRLKERLQTELGGELDG